MTLALCAVVVIAAGLTAHFVGQGLAADFTGDAFYSVLVYLVVGLFAARARPWHVGLVTFALCTAVELLQLTDLPAAAATAFAPLALVLGSGFSAIDLLAYALGTVSAAALDTLLRLWAHRSHHHDL